MPRIIAAPGAEILRARLGSSGTQLERAALDGAARLVQLRDVDADRGVAAATELADEVSGCFRQHHVAAITDSVKPAVEQMLKDSLPELSIR